MNLMEDILSKDNDSDLRCRVKDGVVRCALYKYSTNERLAAASGASLEEAINALEDAVLL